MICLDEMMGTLLTETVIKKPDFRLVYTTLPMNTRQKRNIGSILVVAICILVIFVLRKTSLPVTNEDVLNRRLNECGAYLNNSTHSIPETTRLFINIPKDIYPSDNLTISGHDATAGYISNGGEPGNALGAQGKPDCSSFYLEFSGDGAVDISSPSSSSSIPDYKIHFNVFAK